MRQMSLLGAGLIAVLLLAGCSTSSQCRPVLVTPGIYQGGLPTTQQDFEALQRRGICTILSLETLYYHVAPERQLAAHNKMSFRNVPICPSVVPPSERQVRTALLLLHDPGLRPVFVHCLTGDDRTTFLTGLYRVYYQDWPPQKAWNEMLHSGFHARWWLFGLESYFWHHTQKPAWAAEPSYTAR